MRSTALSVVSPAPSFGTSTSSASTEADQEGTPAAALASSSASRPRSRASASSRASPSDGPAPDRSAETPTHAATPSVAQTPSAVRPRRRDERDASSRSTTVSKGVCSCVAMVPGWLVSRRASAGPRRRVVRTDDRSGGGSSSLGDRRGTMRREDSTSRAFDASRVWRAVRCVGVPATRAQTRARNEFLTTGVLRAYGSRVRKKPEASRHSDSD